MKKINYVDYFKVFENKQKKSIVISIGEYHEFYDCADEKSLDVNSIIGNIFAFYKNTINRIVHAEFPPSFKRRFANQIKQEVANNASVNILVELDMNRCADYEPDPIDAYDSNLFRVCDDFLKNKKKWKWIPIDIRNGIVFLPYLLDITNEIIMYEKYLTEVKVHNLVEDFLLYKPEIDFFLQNYHSDNFFKKQILLSYKKIKKIFKNCTDKTMLDVKPIGYLIGNIITALQDIYCAEFIKNDTINIIYSGASHNRNMESYFRKNNYKIILAGKNTKVNCTSVDLNSLNKILADFYFDAEIEFRQNIGLGLRR